jgi:hypothetical protein
MHQPSRNARAVYAPCLALLALSIPTSTHAGLVQGEVQGVQAGATLELMRNDQVVARIVVQAGQHFSAFLEPGRYTVRCPTKTTAIFALNGPVVQNIDCSDSPSDRQQH